MGTNSILKNKTVQNYFRTQPVSKAYLFGSQARGDATEQSDIDLLLELDENADLFQFVGIKLQLEKILNAHVDLVSTNGISPRLKPYIEKDKILIYERKD